MDFVLNKPIGGSRKVGQVQLCLQMRVHLRVQIPKLLSLNSVFLGLNKGVDVYNVDLTLTEVCV